MIEEVIRLNTETKGGESVKSLRQEIREAKEEALKAARSFGEFSPQATAAAKKVAKLKDEMEDFNQKVAALNPDKFAKIATLTQSVAGGIAAAQGAMVLFGSESEDAAKSLAKVQGAIAFSQGVQQILDMRKQLGSLAADLMGKVKNAFTTVAGASRAVGAALGIGVITAGLALIVKYFDDIKQAAYNLIPGLKNIVGFFTSIVDKVTDWLGVTSEAERANKRLLENTSKTAKDVERELEINGDKYDKYQRERLQAYASYLAAYNEALKNDAKLSATERNELLKDLAARYNRDLQAIDEKRTADAKAEQAKRNADHKKALDERKKADEEFLKEQEDLNNQFKSMQDKARAAEIQAEEDLRLAKLSTRERELEELRIKFEEKKTIIAKGGGDITAIEKLYDIELRNLHDKFNAEDLAATQTHNTATTIENKKSGEEDVANARAVAQAKQQAMQAGFDAAKSVLGLLGVLYKDNEKAQRNIALAQIAIDTAKAISSLVAASNANPTNSVTYGAAGAAQFAAGMVQIAANMASAVMLLKAPNPVSGAAGASTQAAIATPTYQFNSLPGSDVVGNNRVYVLEGDITASQRNVKRNRNVSVF